MRQNPTERRIRRLRATYRKRIAIWAIVMLILGIVLGVAADRLLLNRLDLPGSEPRVVYVTPEPTDTPAPTAEPTATPEPEPEEETEPEEDEEIVTDEFGLGGEEMEAGGDF